MRAIKFGELKVGDKFSCISDGKNEEFFTKIEFLSGYNVKETNTTSLKYFLPKDQDVYIKEIPYTSTFIVGYAGGYCQLRITQHDSDKASWEVEFMSMSMDMTEYSTDKTITITDYNELWELIKKEVTNS